VGQLLAMNIATSGLINIIFVRLVIEFISLIFMIFTLTIVDIWNIGCQKYWGFFSSLFYTDTVDSFGTRDKYSIAYSLIKASQKLI